MEIVSSLLWSLPFLIVLLLAHFICLCFLTGPCGYLRFSIYRVTIMVPDKW